MGATVVWHVRRCPVDEEFVVAADSRGRRAGSRALSPAPTAPPTTPRILLVRPAPTRATARRQRSDWSTVDLDRSTASRLGAATALLTDLEVLPWSITHGDFSTGNLRLHGGDLSPSTGRPSVSHRSGLTSPISRSPRSTTPSSRATSTASRVDTTPTRSASATASPSVWSVRAGPTGWPVARYLYRRDTSISPHPRHLTAALGPRR